MKELRERLANVEQWTKRREEIDEELNRVWVEGSEEELAPPAYVEKEEDGHDEKEEDVAENQISGMSESGALVEKESEEAQTSEEPSSRDN